MRPLELSLEGFRSYRSPVTFNFEDRGLFGVVGPTGAGKSSILDGLVFGLYGRTPQIGKDTKKLIASGTGMARVRLVFSADGTSWEVTRVLREQGASAVVLHRLGDGTPEASGERAVNERIAGIVGLDFDSFCSSVTLPQGEFDRFLKATPTERSRILKRIFRYERVDAMRELAKQRNAAAEVEVKAAEAELAALPADPEALLADLEGRHREAEVRVAALREGAGEFTVAQGVVEAAGAQLAEIERRQVRLAGAVQAIPSGAALEALANDENAGLARLEAARSARDAARVAAQAAAELAEQRQRELGAPLLRARDLLSRLNRVASGAAARSAGLAQSRTVVEQATQQLLAVQAAATEAGQRALDATKAMYAAEQTHAAHLLRAGLRPGEPCPVCEQAVGTVPAVGPTPAALDAARQAVEAAVGEANRWQAKEKAQSGTVASAAARLGAAEENIARATAEATELDSALGQLLGSGPAPAEVARREGLITAASAEAARTRKVADDAGEAAAAVERGLETVARRRRQLAGELIKVCTVVGAEAPGFEDDAASLAGAAKRARDAGRELIDTAAAQLVQVREGAAQAGRLLAGLRARLGLRPDEVIEDALQAASQTLGALEVQIGQARTAIEQRAELQGRLERIIDRKGRYQRLAADLTDARFIAFLLDADRQRLACMGSEKLFQLTGRYRFDEKGDFHLLDLLNDEQRTPDTLSGGETFLASLALALALADAVSQGGSRLECFFLDEGFGSLDPASLDLAMDGIASLASPGRLIGVISHVAGVQAYLDDLIVLDKASDGSTIVAQMEGPIAYPSGAI